MISIFYDLETTDRLFWGQIINYCFIAVDESLREVSRCQGDVRLSPLQLPDPGAILANRVNVLDHQKTAQDSEPEAFQKITKYIDDTIRSHRGETVLIGYNSTKFDLPYLRTSFIRNGLNPYFGGKLSYRDVLHSVRKLSATEENFPRPLVTNEQGEKRLSLRLEGVSQELGILSGVQKHASDADVELTIALANALREGFRHDVCSYQAYEPKNGQFSRGDIALILLPEYQADSEGIARKIPYMLLDENHRYALWIDLETFQAEEYEKSCRWFNKSTGALVCAAEVLKADDELRAIAEKALAHFSSTNLRNFFSQSHCDIEHDIYRIDFDAQEALQKAIWQGDARLLEGSTNKDLRSLYTRFKLNRYQSGGADDEAFAKLLRQYALYRYGGKAQISKGNAEEDDASPRYGPLFRDRVAELFALREAATGEDKELLDALYEYYQKSHLWRVAGEELMRADAPSP